MDRFIYIFIFAVVFLIFKAFFLDDYLENYNASSDATPIEEVSQPPVEEAQTAPALQHNSEPKNPSTNKNEGMPIDELGDQIAEKLDKKL